MRSVQDLLADGKSQNVRRFGWIIQKDQLYHLAHWLDISQKSERDKARIHQFGKKVLPGILLGYALIAGSLGGRYSDCWCWRIGKVGCIRNTSQKIECERSPDNPQKIKKLYFLWHMVQQNYQEETTNSKNPLWDGNPPQGERISAENLMAIGKRVYSRKFHLSSSYWSESSIKRAERRIIPYSTEVHWCHQVNWYRFRRSTRKTNWWLLECRRKQKSVRFVDGFHKIYIIERNSSERIYVVRGETDKNPNDITSKSHMAWRLDKNCKSRTKKRETKMGNRETKTRRCQKIGRNSFY